MKKILLIHTGGTFGMMPLKPSEVLAPGDFQDQVLTLVPEITRLADIDVEIVFNVDSSDIGIPQWNELARLIFKKRNAYDGFVVVHGTDTMVYTAAALSFSLRHLNKPVILTGAQRPLSRLRNDARSNLIDAVETATKEIPEVLIVFGQRILRGNRAKKLSISRYDAFDTPNYPYLGRIGVDIQLYENNLPAPTEPCRLVEGFSDNVAVISAHPSLNPACYAPLLEGEAKAFIVSAFGAGNLPNNNPDWVPFIEKAVSTGRTVVIASHSAWGSVNLNLYASAKKAQEAGAVGIGAMTFEAAYVKLQKILTLHSEPEAVKQAFGENWAGEL